MRDHGFCLAGGSVLCIGAGCSATFLDTTFEDCSLVVLSGALVRLQSCSGDGCTFRISESSRTGINVFLHGPGSCVKMEHGNMCGGVQGVAVHEGAHFQGHNVSFEGMAMTGLEVKDAGSSAKLSKCTFTNFPQRPLNPEDVSIMGIYSHQGGKIVLHNTVVRGCEVGALAQNGAAIRLSNTQIAGCSNTGCIHVLSGSSAEISDCSFSESRGGLYVEGKGTSVTAQQCEFYSNEDNGVFIADHANVELVKCKSRNNGGAGYWARAWSTADGCEQRTGAFMTVIDCLSDGDGEGCGIEGTGTLIAKRVKVFNSVHSSFIVFLGGYAVLEDCTASESQETGVFVGGRVSKAVLRRCHVSGTHRSGVCVQEGSKARLRSCTVKDSRACGMTSHGDGSRILVRDSTIQGNVECGVLVASKAFAKAESCQVEGNLHGLYADGKGSKLKGYNCALTSNEQGGAFSVDEAEVHAMWCQSRGNRVAGYFAQDHGNMRTTRCTSYGERTPFGEHQAELVMENVAIDGGEPQSGRLQSSDRALKWWNLARITTALLQRGGRVTDGDIVSGRMMVSLAYPFTRNSPLTNSQDTHATV